MDKNIHLPAVVPYHGGGFAAGDSDVTFSIHGNIGVPQAAT